MTSLFRYEVGTNVYEDGVTAYPVKGQAVEVEGRRMVELANGVIVPDAGWFASEDEARLQAAADVEALGLRLLAQAKRLRDRQEAAT